MVYTQDEVKIAVPVMLLQDKRLTDADKHVWLIMWLDRKDKAICNLVSPARLAERTGLSRVTIYNALERLASAGWYKAPQPALAPLSRLEEWIDFPADLLTCRDLKSRDIVMYGALQGKAFFLWPETQFTCQALSRQVGRCLKTVRRAVQALKKACWIGTWQKNR